MQKIWKVKQGNRELQQNLIESLKIHPVFAQVLINRELSDLKQAKDFLSSNLSSLHSPFLLKDLKKAVCRIKKALRCKEGILIFGDYDVDGITGCALLELVLSSLGAEVSHYIPKRSQGYGLNLEAIEFARQKNISLLITIDCGITNFEEISLLNRHGIDTIVIDHHYPCADKLPEAFALLDPKRKDCPYPYKELAAVGLAFKLLQALCEDDPNLLEHLDLVCLGTVADVVPITGENRVLVKHGLRFLNDTKKEGLKALIQVSGLNGKDISTGYIGYILAPRINATGRIGSPEASLRLLLTSSFAEAKELARILEQENRQRQRIEDETFQEALSKVEREVNFKDHRVIVLSKEGWHSGVVGIVASRLTERFYRPTIMISLKEDLGRGSGRSVKNFHLFEALTKCKEFLENFGGHQRAIGLTILKDNLTSFKDLINRIACQSLLEEDLIPSLEIDAEIALSCLREELIVQMEGLSPFGVGNPQPVFSSNFLNLKTEPQLLGKDTIRMWVTDGRITLEAIGFRMADSLGICKGKQYDIAYTPRLDYWQGIPSIKLEIKDIKLSR